MVGRQVRGYEAAVCKGVCGLTPHLPTTTLADILLVLCSAPTGTFKMPRLYFPPVCPGFSQARMVLGREGQG